MTRASTAQALNSSAIHLLRGMREVDKTSGLTPARLSALSVLVFGGPTTLGRLARAEGVAGPTMTRIVDGLVHLGMAERQPHPDNSRMTLVSASGDGEALMRAAAQRRVDRISTALSELLPEERQALDEAVKPLQRLVSILHQTE